MSFTKMSKHRSKIRHLFYASYISVSSNLVFDIYIAGPVFVPKVGKLINFVGDLLGFHFKNVEKLRGAMSCLEKCLMYGVCYT